MTFYDFLKRHSDLTKGIAGLLLVAGTFGFLDYQKTKEDELDTLVWCVMNTNGNDTVSTREAMDFAKRYNLLDRFCFDEGINDRNILSKLTHKEKENIINNYVLPTKPMILMK